MDTRGRAPRRRGRLAVLLAATGAAGVLCLVLGVWQLSRLGWKESLIARVQRQLAAAPVPAPGPGAWDTLDRARDEYRPVQLTGRFDHGRETLVTATTALGSGYWVLTPLRAGDGHWVLVNRGFVPPQQRAPSTRLPPAEPQGPIRVEGLLRFSEPHGGLLRDNIPDADRWYSRDVSAIAAARGLKGGPVAPYFIDARALPDAPQWPRAGLTVLQFSNNHAVYAATWFTLAVMAFAGLGFVALDERRLRRRLPPRP